MDGGGKEVRVSGLKVSYPLMGNTCVGPTRVGRNGFLQSVRAAVWRGPLEEDQVPQVTTGGNTTTQATPPEEHKIGAKEKPKEANPSGEANSKKPTHKRKPSAGLQVDSILGRKTANLKELYSIGRKLGQGQFGTTFLCVEKATDKEFACKTIVKRRLVSFEDVESVRREIQIMHHMAGHPHVITIVDAFEDAVAVHLVMELCSGGELFERIVQRGYYSEKKAAELTRMIVGVVEACHSLGVMHRDLKPENFLFMNPEEDSLLKAIDFGLSIFFKPGTLM